MDKRELFASYEGMEMSKIIAFDTETTGFDPDDDEIIQISIVDGDGYVLLDTYVRPERKTEWPKAQAVNGISPELVAGYGTFPEIKEKVAEIFGKAELVVAYNAEFDLSFLERQGIVAESAAVFDVMVEYAPVHGEWNEWRQDWKWQKLQTCADHYGHGFKAHDSCEDAIVTMKCFKSMMEDREKGGYLEVSGLGRNPSMKNRGQLNGKDERGTTEREQCAVVAQEVKKDKAH